MFGIVATLWMCLDANLNLVFDGHQFLVGIHDSGRSAVADLMSKSFDSVFTQREAFHCLVNADAGAITRASRFTNRIVGNDGILGVTKNVYRNSIVLAAVDDPIVIEHISIGPEVIAAGVIAE